MLLSTIADDKFLLADDSNEISSPDLISERNNKIYKCCLQQILGGTLRIKMIIKLIETIHTNYQHKLNK